MLDQELLEFVLRLYRVEHFLTQNGRGYPPNSYISVHLSLWCVTLFHGALLVESRFAVNHCTYVGLVNAVRIEPERIDVEQVMTGFQAVSSMAHGHQDVLGVVSVLVILPHGLTEGGQLEKRNTRRHQPAKGVAEEGMIAKGHQQSTFPVERLGVAMEVLFGRDVLDVGLVCFKDTFGVLVKPGLVPGPQAVDRALGLGLLGVCVICAHKYGASG
mmetsp:Transcript_7164/g.17219  ORF Transcript_7164/g.17219 Transcript_7164/m.17219 type:complete len:215 (+) Transcript_7164:355-999(+)